MLLLTIFYIIGAALIAASIYLNIWRGRRKFNRTNNVGVELFSTYGQKLSARWLENSAQFLSMLFMVIGVIILLAAFFDGKDIMRITHF